MIFHIAMNQISFFVVFVIEDFSALATPLRKNVAREEKKILFLLMHFNWFTSGHTSGGPPPFQSVLGGHLTTT